MRIVPWRYLRERFNLLLSIPRHYENARGENFITVTELADTIVRRENLSFRISHKIVGICVRTALVNGSEVTYEILQNAAKEVLERELSITETELKEILSPENFVAIRTIYGGTAPSETKRALSVERGHETTDDEWFIEKDNYLKDAASNLDKIVDGFVNRES